MNKFGVASVYEKVLGETTDDKLFEVVNGRICRTMRGDSVSALEVV